MAAHSSALCLFIWFSCLPLSAGSLSISFPPLGTPIVGLNTQMVTWKRDEHDPQAQFFFQKIKLAEPGGPTANSSQVQISDSQNDEGTSPMTFDQAGLFEILAVDAESLLSRILLPQDILCYNLRLVLRRIQTQRQKHTA
ncbi:hypothetical protein GYMLUDRAFT_891941 [Collybiopsis luxurians FD-317 M1]|uniref:Uncharacterized protein n=1 Tax=Collybiopsis luxurians FD-317 M1 TaxID=944289 RepID=A0A0D0BJB4_9AGAR|nr:hypothetical protein GYMLUDRAFT_891941 [Collybiopsis luxurians FD-317 M1]